MTQDALEPGAAKEIISRKCTQCAKVVRLSAEHAGKTVKCPSCGVAIGPGPGETVQAAERVDRSDLRATIVAWVVSLLIHAALLVGFGGVSMGVGRGAGEEGIETGIVGDDGPKIEAGDAKLEQVETGPAQLTPVPDAPAKIQPIQDVAPASTSTKEAILALDMGSGVGTKAAAGDWSSFSAAGGGAGGSASFFGLEAKGSSFVYVVDRSGSMDGPKLTSAKAELIRSVSSLKRNMKFFIIFYNDSYIAMPGGRLVKATESSKRQSFGWVDHIQAMGGTDPRGAMQAALALRPDAVWLLSDGLFEDAACDAIRAANPGSRTQIHTIGFHGREGERVLTRIAEYNRGRYRFVR